MRPRSRPWPAPRTSRRGRGPAAGSRRPSRGDPEARLVMVGLDARGDHQPVPGVDGGDREDELRELGLVEGGARALPGRVRHLAVGDQRHRLAQLERRALALVIQRALAPGVERVKALLGLAAGAGVLPVHVDADGATVDLRRADRDELAKLRLQLDRALEPQHGHRWLRRLGQKLNPAGGDWVGHLGLLSGFGRLGAARLLYSVDFTTLTLSR